MLHVEYNLSQLFVWTTWRFIEVTFIGQTDLSSWSQLYSTLSLKSFSVVDLERKARGGAFEVSKGLLTYLFFSSEPFDQLSSSILCCQGGPEVWAAISHSCGGQCVLGESMGSGPGSSFTNCCEILSVCSHMANEMPILSLLCCLVLLRGRQITHPTFYCFFFILFLQYRNVKLLNK